MKHLDLFSGIGGFAYAAQQVWGEQLEIVGFCEIEKFPQQVLTKNFPGIPIYPDITKLKGEDIGTVDILTGGFPCQPFSIAGQRKGSEDERALFPEMLRLIAETKPRWVIAENVYGIVNIENGDYLETIITLLENQGYEVQPYIIPASAVGAPHRRDRIWIVAKNTIFERLSNQWEQNPKIGGQRESITGNGIGFHNESFNPHTTSKRIYGKSRDDKSTRGTNEFNSNNKPFTDSKSIDNRFRGGGLQETSQEKNDRRGFPRELWETHWHEVATRFCRVDDGVSDRTHRLKALGNAIVPQVAIPIMQVIKEIDEEMNEQT